MAYIKKYSKGEPITSLDEMMEQDFIYWSGIITAKQRFKNWQIDMALSAIKNSVIFRAVKIESEEAN